MDLNNPTPLDQYLQSQQEPETPAYPETESQEIAPDQEPMIPVFDPTTSQVGHVPQSKLQGYLSQGYTVATPSQVGGSQNSLKYSSPENMYKTFAEGIGTGGTFGVSTGAERLLGEPAADIRGRAEENPWTHGLGEAVGLTASAFIPAYGEANILAHIGQGAAELLAPKIAGKIGEAAVRSAAEFAAMQTGTEVSKMLYSDPNQTAESVLQNVGLSGALGLLHGAALGSVPPLWSATKSSKLGKTLAAIVDKFGGSSEEPIAKEAIASQAPAAAEPAIGAEASAEIPAEPQEPIEPPPPSPLDGVPTPPKELQPVLAGDQHAVENYKDLRQSPSPSGLKLQKIEKDYRADLSNSILEAVGKTPADVDALADQSPYQAGQKIANQAADEFSESVTPLVKKFEDLKEAKADIPLLQDQTVSNAQIDPYNNQTIAGEMTQLGDKLSGMANGNRWSASSDSRKILNNVLKELPEQKTIGDLGKLQTRIWDENYDPFNGSLNRDVGQIIGLIRNAESDATLRAAEVGEAHPLYNISPDLIAEHQQARAAWSQLSDLRDTLQSKLGIKGGNRVPLGKYAELIKSYASENGEKALQKLTNTNDAHLSNLLQTNFPKTASAVKSHQLDQLLKTVSKNPIEGQSIHANKFFDQLGRLSPETRSAILPVGAASKLKNIQTVVDRFRALDSDRNFSNTAPILMRLLSKAGGSVTSLISMLTGHNPIASAIVGGIADHVGTNAPDAAKLSLLQFLSKKEPVSPEGFKAMTDYIDQAHKGNEALNRAIYNVFTAGSVPLNSALRKNSSNGESQP